MYNVVYDNLWFKRLLCTLCFDSVVFPPPVTTVMRYLKTNKNTVNIPWNIVLNLIFYNYVFPLSMTVIGKINQTLINIFGLDNKTYA